MPVAEKLQGQKRVGQPGLDGDKAGQGDHAGAAGEEQAGGLPVGRGGMA